MAWTYVVSDLATSEKDQIRLEIQDTDTNAQLLQDEEITQAISVEANFWGACARCCEIVARNFLRKADVRVGRGGTMLNYSVAAKQYFDMATAFRKRAIAMNAPWTGGTSISDKLALADDSDTVQPLFTKGMGSSPWVGGEDISVIADFDADEGNQ
ncbi:MAG TPA: hypothetical protein VJQ83_02155 [Tepidiformaceae bacterium]|nr:hypothetical protein [Tepidiformaceae bacterium]